MHIFLLIFCSFQILNCREHQTFFRCGVDDKKIVPLPAKHTIGKKENSNRRLDNEKFGDFHIYLDLINIINDIEKNNLTQYKELFINSLNKAVNTLENLLKVKKLDFGFLFSDEDIENILINDWNKTMIGTNAINDSKSLGIDLFIFGRFDEEMDNSVLASAGPRYIVSGTGQPIVGVVNINPNVNYSKINSQEYFQSIILHEFTHILGFLSGHFEKYLNSLIIRKDENNITRYYINSPRVLAVAKKYYNCSDIDGVELEESGGSGTAGSHWEARILLGEYMNGVIHPEEQVISEFTLALLEDTGYYKANYYTGGLMRYGKGKGCDFIKKRCINSTHQINPNFENEFYDSISSPYGIEASCSSGRQSRTYNAWWLYNYIPEYYRYFNDIQIGGFSPADFCPVAREYYEESINSYYTGHCSTKGNGGYGTKILYPIIEQIRINETHTMSKQSLYYFPSETLYSITGETYSDHSFCYQSTLIKNDLDPSSILTKVRAICYESFCSSKSLIIKINDD